MYAQFTNAHRRLVKENLPPIYRDRVCTLPPPPKLTYRLAVSVHQNYRNAIICICTIRVVARTQSFKYQYKYQYLSLKYQYQYQYPCLKYKYQYSSSKYQYQYQYLKMVLKYRSSTSTSTQYLSWRTVMPQLSVIYNEAENGV